MFMRGVIDNQRLCIFVDELSKLGGAAREAATSLVNPDVLGELVQGLAVSALTKHEALYYTATARKTRSDRALVDIYLSPVSESTMERVVDEIMKKGPGCSKDAVREACWMTGMSGV